MRRLPNNLAVCERRKSKHPLDEGHCSPKRIQRGNVTFEQDSRFRQRQYPHSDGKRCLPSRFFKNFFRYRSACKVVTGNACEAAPRHPWLAWNDAVCYNGTPAWNGARGIIFFIALSDRAKWFRKSTCRARWRDTRLDLCLSERSSGREKSLHFIAINLLSVSRILFLFPRFTAHVHSSRE